MTIYFRQTTGVMFSSLIGLTIDQIMVDSQRIKIHTVIGGYWPYRADSIQAIYGANPIFGKPIRAVEVASPDYETHYTLYVDSGVCVVIVAGEGLSNDWQSRGDETGMVEVTGDWVNTYESGGE